MSLSKSALVLKSPIIIECLQVELFISSLMLRKKSGSSLWLGPYRAAMAMLSLPLSTSNIVAFSLMFLEFNSLKGQDLLMRIMMPRRPFSLIIV